MVDILEWDVRRGGSLLFLKFFAASFDGDSQADLCRLLQILCQ
jgi:hypothetical protein